MKNKTFCVWGQSETQLAKQIASDFNSVPVVVCLGDPNVVADCFAPMVGSMLKQSWGGYVYGTVDSPILASNVDDAMRFVKSVHKDKKILIVDASTTKNPSRLGSIVLTQNYVPFNKRLKSIEADYFLFGVLSVFQNTFPNLVGTKLLLVKKLATILTLALKQIKPTFPL